MKFTQLPSSLLIFLVPSISLVLARAVPDIDDAPTLALPAEDSAPRVAEAYAPEDGFQAQARGLAEAPIDGKDGKPHAGPFVETSAERDRKKAMDQSDKEKNLKPDVKDPPSEHVSPNGEPIPEYNDGVMDDKNRFSPKEGTTGTEGGISEKSREEKAGVEKKPDPPKEALPLPHSEQQKIPGGDDKTSKDKEDGPKDTVLEKPSDLPESPHGVPSQTRPDGSEDHLEIGGRPTAPSSDTSDPTISNEIIQPFHSFVLSLTMILFSEVGDKTFLVAALMAMRHPRMVVFSAAFAALITMTVLSTVLGHAVPTLIPKQYTNFLAAILFLVFGVKMFLEARGMAPDEGVSEEMKEVEMELEEKEHQQRRMSRRRSSITPYLVESGRASTPRKNRSSNHRLPSPDSVSSSSSRESSPSGRSSFSSVAVGMNNLFSLLLSPAWVQTFVMTFLGEWGDRSQIATIAMAAGQDYWWVTWGAISGHAVCTAVAVIGGRAIAGRVSMRVVTFGGAIAFFIFGLIYLFEAFY